MQDIEKNARDAKQIASELDFTLILDGGSLLGAYRDGGPIKGDEHDVDFAVPYAAAEFKMLQIMQAFATYGFNLKRLRPTVMSWERGENHVDLLFYRHVVEDYSFGDPPREQWYYQTLYHEKRANMLLVPMESYDDLGTIDFLGTTFTCPKDIETHLKHRYGDWRTPVLRPHFTFQHFIDRGVMIPLK